MREGRCAVKNRTKKVILFIVEGPTDADTLSPVLKKIFKPGDIHFHVVHGDITTIKKSSYDAVMSRLSSQISEEMKRYRFTKKDVVRIIHIVDTDGAFVSTDNVVFREIHHIEYGNDHIYTDNPVSIIGRNRQKSSALRQLSSAQTVAGIPYSVHYFSRNIEHVMHNQPGNLTSDQKMYYADEFVKIYGNSPEKFLKFIFSKDFAVSGSYSETWDFIMENCNSLHRHSNLHLIFADNK